MLIELELNRNDAEALLRHCDAYEPNSGDYREDSRLADALETLASAIRESMNKESMEPVDPRTAGRRDHPVWRHSARPELVVQAHSGSRR